jgi:hypothetical protein
MLLRPLTNQLSCGARPNLAFDDSPAKIDHCILTVILGVEMWRSVIVEVHANNDPEERRDDRHSGNRNRTNANYPFTHGNSHRPSPSSSFGKGTGLPIRLSCVSSQSFAYFKNV